MKKLAKICTWWQRFNILNTLRVLINQLREKYPDGRMNAEHQQAIHKDQIQMANDYWGSA